MGRNQLGVLTMSDLSRIPEHIKNQPWSVLVVSNGYDGKWFNYENLEEAIAGLNRLVIAAANDDAAFDMTARQFGGVWNYAIEREYRIVPTVLTDL